MIAMMRRQEVEMLHEWKPSKLGHGTMMCSRCFTTDAEAAALGITNVCDAPAPPPPRPANTNFSQEQIDDELSDEVDLAGDDEIEADMNCGKYPGSRGCSLAGTEWCDWSCPYSR